MLVIYRKGLRQIHTSKSKGKFEISEENIIRSIPGYDSVIEKAKGLRLCGCLSTKPNKRKREGRTSLCIVHDCTVPKLSPYSKLIADISHFSVKPQCGQFG